MCAKSQCWETEGLCESPHDDPPKWAFMLTAYLDESSDGCFWVMAGYLGTKKKWDKYCENWKAAIAPKKSLHLSAMRLNFASKHRSNETQELFKRAANVPKECGLKPFLGMVILLDYEHLVANSAEAIALDGYMLALENCVESLLRILPKNERVELIFERQTDFASRRESLLSYLQDVPNYRTSRGAPMIAKWSSIPKGTLIEASDCLAYAYVQKCADPHSGKALLTQPFLKAQRYELGHLSKAKIEYLIEFARARSGGKPPLIDKQRKRELRAELKKHPVRPDAAS
jgi:hypothetical protein